MMSILLENPMITALLIIIAGLLAVAIAAALIYAALAPDAFVASARLMPLKRIGARI
ncbi:MAG TPA: hypothetical protein VMA30_03495 [Xanthobacteraceae bacterium]|nr:hypothetical protein [Xanthobacteraceae bacterium]